MHLSLILNGNRSLQTREVRDCRNLILRFWAQAGKYETAQEVLQIRGAWSFSKNPEKPKFGDMRWPPQPGAHFAQADGGNAENLHFLYIVFTACTPAHNSPSPLFPGGKTPPDWSLLPGSPSTLPQHWLFISASSAPATKPFTGATNCAQSFRMWLFLDHTLKHPQTTLHARILYSMYASADSLIVYLKYYNIDYISPIYCILVKYIIC